MGACEHEKQAHKDTHAQNAHDFPATMAGKFPKMHVWVRGDTGRVTAGNGCSRMVASAKISRYKRCIPKKQQKTKQKSERGNRSGDRTKQENNNKKWLESNQKKSKTQLVHKQNGDQNARSKEFNANVRGVDLSRRSCWLVHGQRAHRPNATLNLPKNQN